MKKSGYKDPYIISTKKEKSRILKRNNEKVYYEYQDKTNGSLIYKIRLFL